MGGGNIRSRYQKITSHKFTVNNYFGKDRNNTRLHKNFKHYLYPVISFNSSTTKHPAIGCNAFPCLTAFTLQ